MEYLMFLMVPVGFLTSVGFAFICYYEWAPTEWELSRYISIALFDLFVIFNNILYMAMAVQMDSEFQKKFNNLRPIAWLRRRMRLKPPTYRKSALKSGHSEQPGTSATTDSYFAQLNASWLR
ncbi:hypothetical protein PMAYCL1PPCAC_00956 [Pristionchus mayeri]|uniref:G protein-coupled receptor n=1 Tax=Pristionchus mayeri TaxID=1317129 RepID=A0AAN4Z1D4_9BILA|nr:hypothetical protein PMAYCL1PPCAC_00956 [Pristionchus mayeri]